MRLIDTNVFIRYLTFDDEAKAQACETLFARLDAGEEDAFTTEAVVAEIFYVLSGSSYRLSRDEVARSVRPLLLFRGLRLENRSRIMATLDLCEAFPSLDFEDCLSVIQMQEAGVDELYSYDRGFNLIPGISRLEPVSP